MALAWRISAYDGVLTMRVQEQRRERDGEAAPGPAPAAAAPRPATARSAPAAAPSAAGQAGKKPGFLRPHLVSAPGVDVLEPAAFAAMHPGLIERRRVTTAP